MILKKSIRNYITKIALMQQVEDSMTSLKSAKKNYYSGRYKNKQNKN